MITERWPRKSFPTARAQNYRLFNKRTSDLALGERDLASMEVTSSALLEWYLVARFLCLESSGGPVWKLEGQFLAKPEHRAAVWAAQGGFQGEAESGRPGLQLIHSFPC